MCDCCGVARGTGQGRKEAGDCARLSAGVGALTPMPVAVPLRRWGAVTLHVGDPPRAPKAPISTRQRHPNAPPTSPHSFLNAPLPPLLRSAGGAVGNGAGSLRRRARRHARRPGGGGLLQLDGGAADAGARERLGGGARKVQQGQVSVRGSRSCGKR